MSWIEWLLAHTSAVSAQKQEEFATVRMLRSRRERCGKVPGAGSEPDIAEPMRKRTS